MISHHFGKVNQGAYEFFGLDQSTIRLGLEYGLTDRLALGLGRSTFQKTFDGFVKYKLLRQSTGNKKMPVSVTYFGGIDVNTLKWEKSDQKYYFSNRLSYCNELLIARKFSSLFSLQLNAAYVHKNMVENYDENNDKIAAGLGLRMKLSSRFSFNYELMNSDLAQDYGDIHDMSYVMSVGCDVETGGHVFQLFFTNAQPMFERGYFFEKQGDWLNGDIYFGFNISRTFTIVKPKSFKNM
jgi:hypothetical protein